MVHFPAKVLLLCNELLVPLPGRFAPLLVLLNHSLAHGPSPNPTQTETADNIRMEDRNPIGNRALTDSSGKN